MADQTEHIKNLFLPHDPQQTGTVGSEHFPNILAQSGFNFNPRLVSNLAGVVDPWGQGVSFGSFVWLHGLLSHAQATFQAQAPSGSLPSGNIGGVLQALGYNLPASTVTSLSLYGDRAKTGSITFEQLVSVIAFLLFTRNQFSAADQQQSNKLTLDVVEQQLLPALGLEGAGHDQALAIFKKFDADNSGTIEFEEFVAMAIALKFPELAQ